jgi:hypothetical protein
MATITIADLSTNRALDCKAMSRVKGGGAPWVFGWIRPFVPGTSGIGPGVNFFQINNNYFADQMINQFQVIEVNNSGANSNINLAVTGTSSNLK